MKTRRYWKFFMKIFWKPQIPFYTLSERDRGLLEWFLITNCCPIGSHSTLRMGQQLRNKDEKEAIGNPVFWERQSQPAYSPLAPWAAEMPSYWLLSSLYFGNSEIFKNSSYFLYPRDQFFESARTFNYILNGIIFCRSLHQDKFTSEEGLRCLPLSTLLFLFSPGFPFP